MKLYRCLGIVLVVGAALVSWPLVVSSQEPSKKAASGEQMNQPEQSKMDKYKKDFEKEMRAFDKKIANLGSKVKQQGSKAGTEAKESWNDLKVKQTHAKNKLKSLSKEAWEKTKTEADAAREDLRKAYDKAASYFK